VQRDHELYSAVRVDGGVVSGAEVLRASLQVRHERLKNNRNGGSGVDKKAKVAIDRRFLSGLRCEDATAVISVHVACYRDDGRY